LPKRHLAGSGYRKRYIMIIELGVVGIIHQLTSLHWERSSAKDKGSAGPAQWCCECGDVIRQIMQNGIYKKYDYYIAYW